MFNLRLNAVFGLMGLMILGVLMGCFSKGEAGVVVGKKVPAFTLTDATGTERSLSDFSGKIVVLEWKNHLCPFVKKHYGSGNMQQLQSRFTQQGVVWLSIISSAPGKQGYVSGDEALALASQEGSSATAILLDPDGTVGRLYGAKTTPHFFIVDSKGKLAYRGAIDSVASTNPADIAEATCYVSDALDRLLNGDMPVVSDTVPYGCSVKY